MGPVMGKDDEGEYTCLYQLTKKAGLANSTVSNVVRVTITGEDVDDLKGHSCQSFLFCAYNYSLSHFVYQCAFF